MSTTHRTPTTPRRLASALSAATLGLAIAAGLFVSPAALARVALLPSVQAESVPAVGALTPMTVPSQNPMHDVPLLVAPQGNPWFCFGGRCIGTATAQRDVDGLPRGASGRLTPDARPLLVVPSCTSGNCRPTQNIGQAQPSIQGNESFDATPVLVAPDCGSVVCNWLRFFG